MIRYLLDYLFKLILGTVLLVTITSAGVLYYFGETDSGLISLITICKRYIPGELDVGQAHGKLFSGFSLQQIKYRNESMTINVETARLDWNIKSLLRRKLDIDDLEISHLQIHSSTTKSTEPSHPLKNLEYLKYAEYIVAHKVQISDFTFQQDQDEVFNLTKLQLDEFSTGSILLYAQSKFGDIHGKFTSNLSVPTTFSFQVEGTHLIGDEIVNIKGTLTQNWNVAWNVRIPNVCSLLAKGHGSFNSSGKISGPRLHPAILFDFNAHALAFNQDQIKDLSGKVNVTLQPDTAFALNLIGSGINIDKQELAKLNLSVNGISHLQKNHLLTNADISIADKPYIKASLTLPRNINLDNYAKAPLSAELKINFPDIHALREYIPAISEPHGNIIGALQFNGSLAQININGDVKLNNGNMQLPKLGIAVEKIILHIQGDQSRHINYSGSFQIGKGSAQLQGATDLSKKDFPTEIHCRGNNLQIVNLADYKIIATPELTLHFNNFKLSIDGNLLIPEAAITPKDFRQTVTLSDDIVFVGENTKKQPASIADGFTSMPIMKVNVKLDNIKLQYQDLKTKLAGNLVIQTSEQTPPTATGMLYTKDGTYHAYGQVLKINVGRLNYAGGLLSNPGLDIKASRNITTVNTGSASSFNSQKINMGSSVLTVGVQILGTLDKPKISLFSSTGGISQDDILSYLVLGIPRSQASLSDSLAILNATSSLSTNNSAPAKLLGLKQKLQKGLGLAELNVEKVQTFDPSANANAGGVVGTTSLVLGKKLTKNLYAHYSISLFNSTPVSIFNLRYQLSKHWSVQSETSALDNGADILYSIERD